MILYTRIVANEVGRTEDDTKEKTVLHIPKDVYISDELWNGENAKRITEITVDKEHDKYVSFGME